MARHVFALVVKEFLTLLKDKRSRTIFIVLPLAQLIIFSYGATFDLSHVPYAVYNEDRGLVSRQILARFAGSPAFQLVARVDHAGQIAPMINSERVLMVLHLGPHFSRNLLLGHSGQLQLIVDGRNSNTAMLIVNYLRTMGQKFNAQWVAAHGHSPPPARLKVRDWFNPNLESRWFIVPGIVGLLTLVMTLLHASLCVAQEREEGTFDQLLVTPLRPVEILLGKALPGFIIGSLQASFIIVVAVWWFQVPLRGSLIALYLGVFLFLLSAVGIGLMISSVALTQQQALFGGFMFLVPAVILSGFATPIANMPLFMQDMTLLNPMRYFMAILRGVFLEGTPVSVLWPQYWPMGLIGAVNLAIAGRLFRHRLY